MIKSTHQRQTLTTTLLDWQLFRLFSAPVLLCTSAQCAVNPGSRQPWTCGWMIAPGKVGHAVNRLSAKLKADLMDMGATARRGVAAAVIGNSAEKVLTQARCDVLALKP